jgi:hypothetical protein
MIPKKLRSAVLAAVLLFQIVDSTRAFNGVRERFTNTPEWTSQLKDPQWDIWAKQYKKILVAPPLNNDARELWLDITDYAASNGMSTNSGYFSRYDTSLYESEYLRLKEELTGGEFKDSTIYVVLDIELWLKLLGNPKIKESKMSTVDSLHVLSP